MNLFKKIREKSELSKQENIRKQSKWIITTVDFDNHLYIGVDGIPLILVEDSWTVQDILDKLNTCRETYVQSKIKKD